MEEILDSIFENNICCAIAYLLESIPGLLTRCASNVQFKDRIRGIRRKIPSVLGTIEVKSVNTNITVTFS